MGIKIVLKDTENNEYSYYEIISFKYESEYLLPCDGLEFELPFKNGNKDLIFTEVKYYLDNSLIFDGVVDKQEYVFSSKGFVAKFSCRSRLALLLDNEVKPCYYNNISSDDVIRIYGYEYGIKKANLPYKTECSDFEVKKGYSNFKAIQMFCNKKYNKFPFVNSSGELSLTPITNRKIIISNLKQYKALNYFNLTFVHDTSKYISSIHIKTSDELYGGYYGTAVTDKLSNKLKLKRERYFVPRTSGKQAVLDSEYLLKKQNINVNSIKIYLCGNCNIKVGDLVSIPEYEVKEDYFVGKVTTSFDSKNGFVTIIRLFKTEYV